MEISVLRRVLLFAAIAAVAAGLMSAGTAVAANVKWNVDPYCSQTGTNQLTCSGKATGLGSLPLYVVVQADAGCRNQDGTHTIPGQSLSVSGPFDSTNGNFTFGAEDKSANPNVVTASGPTSCPGASMSPFITTNNVTLSIYECTGGSGPTFNRKNQQTNNSCTRVLGPTQAAIV